MEMPSVKYFRAKQKVHHIIDQNVWFASFFGILVFANIFLFIVELDTAFLEKYLFYFNILELVSVIAFTSDYILRIWTCTLIEKYKSPVKGRLRYVISPLMLADLLPLLHFYVPALIPLNVIIFRIFRLFRLNHVTDIIQRKQTFYEIFEGVGKSRYHSGFALFIASLILLDITIILIDYIVPQFYDTYQLEVRMFEFFTLFVFTFEYILRVWVCTLNPSYSHPIKGRLKYMAQPLSIIDLLTVLVFYVPAFIPFDVVVLRVFRLFRLFRALKFAHFRTKSGNTTGRNASDEPNLDPHDGLAYQRDFSGRSRL